MIDREEELFLQGLVGSLDLNDADDRATFRARIDHEFRHMTMVALRRLVRAPCRSRSDAVRRLADAIIAQQAVCTICYTRWDLPGGCRCEQEVKE